MRRTSALALDPRSTSVECVLCAQRVPSGSSHLCSVDDQSGVTAEQVIEILQGQLHELTAELARQIEALS
jgi:hypothetical protein